MWARDGGDQGGIANDPSGEMEEDPEPEPRSAEDREPSRELETDHGLKSAAGEGVDHSEC